MDTTQTTNWVCAHGTKLTSLVAGYTMVFVPSASGTGQVNVDGLGSKSVRLKDGVTLAMLVAGEPYLLYFDGTVWRVVA